MHSRTKCTIRENTKGLKTLQYFTNMKHSRHKYRNDYDEYELKKEIYYCLMK
jgi:hypothetical protein